MITSAQGQFKKTQALKVYHLIQQVTGHKTSALSINQLQFFVNVMQENKLFSPTLLNNLNPSGKELTQQWFASCVAQYFEESVGQYVQLISFNKGIRDFLLGTYLIGNPLFKIIKEDYAPPIYDQLTYRQYEVQTLQFLQNLKFGIAINFIQGILKMINHAMSSIYYSYDLFSKVGKEIALIQIDSSLLKFIFQDPSNPATIEDHYKFLLFLAEATAFEEINNKLNLNPYFYNVQFWKNHLKNYFDYIGCQTDVISVKISIEAFILNYIRICPKFADFFIDWLSKNPQATQLIVSVCHHPQQPLFVKYSLLIFIQILKKSQKNKGKNCFCLANSNIIDFQTYAMKVLKNGSPITLQSSIKLISQTTKVNLGNYYNQRNVGFILKALQGDKPDIKLARMVLLVFENSLKYDNAQVYWVFARSKACIQYIKSNLLKHFQKESESLHCICLQILFHLIKPDLLSIFQQNQILQLLAYTLNQNASYFSTFISKIMCKMAQIFTVKNRFQILRSNTGLMIVSKLLQFQGLGVDDLMSSFLNGSDIMYFNKQIFLKCIKTIYLMDKFREKNVTRWYEYQKDIQHSVILFRQLELFIKKILDKKIQKSQLWGEVEFPNQENVKVIKLIGLITDQVMLSHKDKSVPQKKQLFQFKNRLFNQIYAVLTPHELQIENIPIFIEIYFRTLKPFQKTILRRLPSTLNYQSFKSYSLSIYNYVIFNQQNEISVGDKQIFNMRNIFFIDEFHHRAEIRGDNEFKKLIKSSFQDINHKYQICLSIHFDKEPNNYEELSYYNKIASFTNKQYYNSVRGPTVSSPYGGSLRLDNYSRSKSPIRNTTSVFVPSVPHSVHKCQNCHANPSPYHRFCQSCNRMA